MPNVQAPETISGKVESVVYHNESNDYTVLEIADAEGNLITCVGILPKTFEGECVTFEGRFVTHKDFGRQFAFERFEKKLPEEIDGVLQYLSSRTIKGLGPVTALKIVNRFGTESFDVIENHPEYLSDIPGITPKKAAAISESFREQNGMRGVMMFCKDHLGVNEVTRVYKRFGSGAVGIIKENPYILCEGEDPLPFPRVDEFASSLGFAADAARRIFAGIVYILNYNAQANGHTCLPEEKLISAAAETLSLAEETVKNALPPFLSDKSLGALRMNDKVYYMTAPVERAETYIASRMRRLEREAEKLSQGDILAMIEKVERRAGIEYAKLQKQAIFEALDGGVMILTGGPGTGKTTVVKALLSIFESLGMKTVLAAPTGRAAKRMSEATSHEAKTLHRLLETERRADGGSHFCRREINPIDEACVIVDEASMIDLFLMEGLMRALKRGARLVLIGDADQLPSVGAGNVLSDLISSGMLRTVRLSEIFRQSQESLIITNAHRINAGENPVLNATDRDFFFVRRDDERTIPETVVSLVTERLPKTYGADILHRIQIITPSKKGVAGVESLNTLLQSKLNPPGRFKKEIASHGVTFREGDRVMQTRNDYDIEWQQDGTEGLGIFNGDIGTVIAIRPREEEVLIRFDDREATYPFEKLGELDLAYAITVHKSQGSEYPVVILPMYSCPPMLRTRNLFYTAVTRAKEMVILVGRPDVPGQMVANNRHDMRYTALEYRLKNGN